MSTSSWDDAESWSTETTHAGTFGLSFRRFSLAGSLPGGEEVRFESMSDRCTVGVHERNDLVLADPTVSRFHAELQIRAEGPYLRDVGSRNGTFVDGVRVDGAWLRDGSTLRIGKTKLTFRVLRGQNRVKVSARDHFGTMYGTSLAMRRLFALLEKVAPSDATVLLTGETGTGKEEAALSLHGQSRRAEGPFQTLDCAAIPASLLESELFGHEEGAFTGATASRQGVFEAAHGGTLFLDEIGELPLNMQPALLRVLEAREVRRVGANQRRPVDVRVVAATHRDLREEVSAGRFREDLYYRLAVFTVFIPPLRDRPEDIVGLADVLLARLGLERPEIDEALGGTLKTELLRGQWRGNVRELRNYLSRFAVLGEASELGPPAAGAASSSVPVDARLSYADARTRAVEVFEKEYAEALLHLHDGNVSAAARAAGMARPYLHRLLRKHGLR